MKSKLLVFCAICFLSGMPVYSQEGEVARLEAVTTEILDILYEDDYRDYTYEEKANAIRSVLERDYNLMVIIRRTMARNWKLLSPPEQVKVKDLVASLIINAFIEGVQGLDRPTVAYGELVMITDKRFEIPSVITFSDERVFNIAYRFGRLQTGWQIYDIVVEEVSVVSNYRQQISDHFRKGTGAELIEKLEKLLEEKKLNETSEP